MKVGDLVKYKNLHGQVVGGKFISKGWTGMIIEEFPKGILKVLWSHGAMAEENRSALEIIR